MEQKNWKDNESWRNVQLILMRTCRPTEKRRRVCGLVIDCIVLPEWRSQIVCHAAPAVPIF